MFDKDFPLGGGSTEASTSVTGPQEEMGRKREVYYAIPVHRFGQSKDGEDSIGRFKAHRRKGTRANGRPTEPLENDPDEFGDVDEVVVDNSFEIGGQQESLTEPSAGPNVTENRPAVAMQPGQGKWTGGAFGWDPKDKQNGLPLSSSQ